MPRPMGPNRGVPETSKDFGGSIKRLFNSLNKWRYLLILSLVLAMISAILALVAPNKLSDLTDTITLGISPNINENIVKDIMNDKNISVEDKKEFSNILSSVNKDSDVNSLLDKVDSLPESIYDIIKPKMDIARVKSIGLFLAIIYIISSLFNYIQSLLMTTISNNFAKRLRTNISKKINKLPLKYFDIHETGDVLSRVTNDIDTIAQNMNHSLVSLVTSLTLFLGSIIMMFVTNWVMAITAIVSSVLGFSLMGILLGKSQKYFTQRQEELGELNGFIEEIYSGHNIVKVYNGEKDAINNFNELNTKLYDSNRKSQFLSGIMQPIMMFVGNLGYVAVCVVGALLVMNNHISFGIIVAFMIYVRMFTNPLSQIAQAMTSLQMTTAASERVFEF